MFKRMKNIRSVVLILFTPCFLIIYGCGKELPSFNGDEAMEYLTAQTDYGPRNPGSAAARECRDYLVNELEKYADRVLLQPFTFTDNDSVFECTNIIASFNLSPKDGHRYLFTAHWDSRRWADRDAESRNHESPILGANDGASGVAVLMLAAKIMKEFPPEKGVDIVFFDAEDSGTEGDNSSWCLGSRHFADNLGEYRPVFGVLLDLVGDKDLRLPMEGNSLIYAFDLTNRIWETAEELDLPAFIKEEGPIVYDDHIPLNQAGIPTVDIIDFDYPYWHTVEDTPDKCSAESLAQVGKLILALIYE